MDLQERSAQMESMYNAMRAAKFGDNEFEPKYEFLRPLVGVERNRTQEYIIDHNWSIEMYISNDIYEGKAERADFCFNLKYRGNYVNVDSIYNLPNHISYNFTRSYSSREYELDCGSFADIHRVIDYIRAEHPLSQDDQIAERGYGMETQEVKIQEYDEYMLREKLEREEAIRREIRAKYSEEYRQRQISINIHDSMLVNSKISDLFDDGCKNIEGEHNE